eukprot:10921.XXX_207664_207867_1 [CDS] Oithona nana genome sequencing.
MILFSLCNGSVDKAFLPFLAIFRGVWLPDANFRFLFPTAIFMWKYATLDFKSSNFTVELDWNLETSR